MCLLSLLSKRLYVKITLMCNMKLLLEAILVGYEQKDRNMIFTTSKLHTLICFLHISVLVMYSKCFVDTKLLVKKLYVVLRNFNIDVGA